MEKFDVIVIGGGPGGYVAAVRASQLGFKTALVEREHMGGTCLNWGCIPTKALLHNAEVIHLLSKSKTYGFSFENLEVDYSAAHKRSRSIVKRQTKRVEFLMKNNGITVYKGTGSLVNPDQVKIEPTGEILAARHIILATGAKPRPLPGITYDGKSVMTYKNALDLTRVPESAVIVGAGPIGMEFATIWNRYGTKVTVVEMLPHVLPLEDEDVSLEAQKQFKRNKIQVRTGTVVEGINSEGDMVEVSLNKEGETESLEVETVLVSIGVIADSSGLNLDQCGVEDKQGKIIIDDQMRTTNPNIYAIGDITGKMPLAHVASAQGIIAAEAIAGKPTQKIIYPNIPRCTYSQPEVASVGLTEKQAKEQGYDVQTAQCPFIANGKAIGMEDNSGFAKIVAETKDKKILGVHLIGGHITELVAGPTGMITLEAGFDKLAETIHPHPTLSEALMEAAHALCGHAIHI
jgi:dihydrolipoyl dehydrogenase